jgi:signal transduction histidine kinase/CheY-like chemotaxis protein
VASEGLNDDRRGMAAFAVVGGTIFGRMFRPPARFAAEVEAAFREEALKRWQTARNAAIALVALLWVSYFGWDYFHALRNKDFRPALEEIVALRLAGVLCIAAAAGVLILRRHSHTAVNAALSFCLCALYTLSLAMIAVSSFPYNYLFYYICLPLILMFMFGLFRLPSRLVYALTGFCLVASFGFLLFAQTTDASTPKSLVELMSKSLSYYNVAAVLFLASFSAIGCAVAVELERTARDAFTRERQLSDRNASLEASQRETRVKTSALVKAKDELRRLAERQNVAKSKFLADAAHDLRQPMQALTNLLGAARHALDKGDGARCDEILTLAQDASRLTRNSFNAVLDISRLESGFVEAGLADFDLPALIEEVAAPCLAVAEERGVEVRLRWRKDPAIAVRSDHHLLGRVIGNLLSNAIKYSDPAKKGSTVILGVVCLPSRVRIDIVDNGVGIREADWARVFSPFVQLHNDERDRDKGVGLGLSIVNAIIPLLPEHRLDMRSSEGQGTRFSLELPYGIASSQAALPATPARTDGIRDLSGLYVVYVEDDSLVRRSTLALFDMLEIRYEAYGSYAELEAGLPKLERDPDLLITDYRLPDARTAQDVVRLTSWTFERVLPLIVVTGEMTPLDTGSWLAGGKILRKPVAPEALTAEISSLCPAAGPEPEQQSHA